MVKISQDYIIRTIKDHEKEIKKNFGVKNISLFGSYAKKTQTENSDIDILVEFEKSKKDDFDNELNLQVYLYNLFKKDIGLCEKNEIKDEFKPYILNENLIKIC